MADALGAKSPFSIYVFEDVKDKKIRTKAGGIPTAANPAATGPPERIRGMPILKGSREFRPYAGYINSKRAV